MVNWTETARNDMNSIYDFIVPDNPDAAKTFIIKIINKAESIEDFPRAGRIVPELGSEFIRELIHEGKYRIIYLLKNEQEFDILAILHTSKKFKL